ncbi:hypothetical protein PC120_g25811 [Phytophthora cactorum]|nr:hypothetical protein PC120_g25811 [Phytophthora cactorum]
MSRQGTHAQRDGAELARIRIRQNERQLRSGTRSAVPTLPPLAVSNRVSLETHRTEEIDRSRHEEKATHLAIHGKQRVTRNTAALLKKDREEDADSPPGEGWESRVLRHMFPASTASADSTDDGSALDDSDFEEGKNKFPRDGTPDESDSSESAFTVKSSGETADEIRVDGRDGEEEAEALSSGDDYVDQSSDENEEEDSSNNDQSESEEQSNFGALPKLHRTKYKTRKSRKISVPVLFGSLKTKYVSWEKFHTAFEIFQRETYQQFSKRSSTSLKIRNNQMTKNAEALKTAGKRARKTMNLIPTSWVHYSKTLKCVHGQKYKPRGRGKRKHRKVRDMKCSAKLNAHVTATSSGGWELNVSASGMHSHRISKALWESYAEKRTVKDPMLTKDVEVLHRAGANVKGILRYLRERTDNQVNQEDLNGGKDAEAEKKSAERTEKDDEPNETKNAPKTQKNQSDSKKKSGVVTWKLADRPLVNRMTKTQRKRAKSKESHILARALAAKYREGTIEKMAIDQVVALLDGSYSMFHTKYMVDALVLPTVEVRGKLSVRSYAVGQDIPVGKSIPQMNKVMEAIETIKIIDDIDLFAYWPDYGYARLTN